MCRAARRAASLEREVHRLCCCSRGVKSVQHDFAESLCSQGVILVACYTDGGKPTVTRRACSRSGLLCSPPSELLGPPPPRQTCLGYCGQECVPVCVKCSLRWECRGRPHCRPRQTDRRRIRRLPSVTAASRAPPIYKKHTSLKIGARGSWLSSSTAGAARRDAPGPSAARERRASPARAVLEPRASIARNINHIAFWSRFRCTFWAVWGGAHELVARNRSTKRMSKRHLNREQPQRF